MRLNPLLKKELVVVLAIVFIGTSTSTLAEPVTTSLTKTKTTLENHPSFRDQTEVKYYNPDTLNNVIGIQGGTPPYVWQTAIRLTQTELGPYHAWNLTEVVIGFAEDPDEGPMNVTVIIYDQGTPTQPGSVIVNDTWAILSGTDLFTVPLTTTVWLAGHTEIWVAVKWTQQVDMTHYAFIDGGPAVDGKGDWLYLNGAWLELQTAPIDSNWAIGAIVEGTIHPPATPGQPDGPDTGVITRPYSFSAVTMDPDQDSLSYLFDWGDGTDSGWIGPYASGEIATASHAWTKAITYHIKVKAKDAGGLETNWSPAASISIRTPILTIHDVKGGRGIHAVLTNVGNGTATNVTWTIDLAGKFIFHGAHSTGFVASMPPGNSTAIFNTALLLGLGKISFNASTFCAEGVVTSNQGTGFLFLRFVFGVKEVPQ